MWRTRCHSKTRGMGAFWADRFCVIDFAIVAIDFVVVALGSGLAADAIANLKSAACSIDGVFIQVADNDEQALIQALGAYYQYLAMGNMIAEVQPTRWSEPYYSIPDIYGLVTTAASFSGAIGWNVELFDTSKARSMQEMVDAITSNQPGRIERMVLVFERPVDAD